MNTLPLSPAKRVPSAKASTARPLDTERTVRFVPRVDTRKPVDRGTRLEALLQRPASRTLAQTVIEERTFIVKTGLLFGVVQGVCLVGQASTVVAAGGSATAFLAPVSMATLAGAAVAAYVAHMQRKNSPAASAAGALVSAWVLTTLNAKGVPLFVAGPIAGLAGKKMADAVDDVFDFIADVACRTGEVASRFTREQYCLIGPSVALGAVAATLAAEETSTLTKALSKTAPLWLPLGAATVAHNRNKAALLPPREA